MRKQDVDTSQKKILIADDSLDIRRFWGVFLESLGLEYLTVENGFEASQRFMDYDFDAVLLDLEMPEMDGFETAQFIKTICPECPVIAVSARDSLEDMQKISQIGFDGYLPKPINLPLALNKIQTLLTLQ